MEFGEGITRSGVVRGGRAALPLAPRGARGNGEKRGVWPKPFEIPCAAQSEVRGAGRAG